MPSAHRQQKERLVAVMGPTGAGKSTFIQAATRQDGQTIGHGLRSYTSEIQTVKAIDPDGSPVVFVDTPGFDDTYKSDTVVLSLIADWLVKTYKGKVNLTTIIYLHRISDNRMAGSVLRNLRVFASLCGQEAMPNVILATTMWGQVAKETGARREEQLQKEWWKDMLDEGCEIERFDNSYDSAWRIVHSFAGKDRAPVLLPSEMVDSQLRLNETKAGIALNNELLKLINEQKEAARRLSEQACTQDNGMVVQELNQRKAEIDEKIRQTADQLLQMKIPFARRVRLFFKGNHS